MLYIILSTVIVVLAVLAAAIYRRASTTLQSIDRALDAAIGGEFYESSFTEKRLSKIESKLHRYLSAGDASLKRIEEEKDGIKTLISDISHQTKTPVSNILLYSQLLKETPDLSDDEREIAGRIEEQTEKLSFLISSLIKLSRLENGIVNVAPSKNGVDKLLGSIDCRAAADKKGVSLSVEAAPGLAAVFDFKWTLEALTNIVDNAVKYTPSGGRVEVRAMEYEMFVCIDVEDNGVGISEKETAKIFARFYRSPRARDEKGVGIGLYLAREIVSKEGGYIKVKSSPGKGSVFSVFLPKQANLSKL